VVTQLLPNGNMVIEGKQEVRLNYEMRELIIAGVIRPEDIASDNAIDMSKIAEARLSYGGRGQLMNIQQERWGQQAADVILPF
jgi:flagellar L-ring protein FlgH